MYPKLAKVMKEYDPSGFETPTYNAMRDKLIAQGRRLINFVVGDPVRPEGYETPDFITNELVKAAGARKMSYPRYYGKLPYPGAPGAWAINQEFKEAVVRREKIVHGVTYNPNDVFPCAGSGGGIISFYFTVAQPGDEWLCCEPIYANYWATHAFPPFSFKWVSWRKDETRGWAPDLDDLRSKVTDKTTCISIVNPCNPTGAVFSEKDLKGIVDIAGEYELLIQVDEVMDVLPLDGSITKSIAEVAGDVPTIVLNGFSKSMLTPGWRVGWLCIHDPKDKILEIRKGMSKLSRIMGTYPIPTPILIAATNVMNNMKDFQAHLRPTVRTIAKRAAYANKRISEIDALSMVPVKAGFWGFAKYKGFGTVWKNDEEMELDLVQYGGGDKGVAITGGPTWGPVGGPNHFRVPVFESEDVLEEGFNRLGAFFRERLK